MSRHVVMYSSGIGSWATAKRVIDIHGPQDVTLLFADVGGDHSSPYVGEDPDNYRFVEETAAKFGCELVTLNAGRNIWEVFRDDRFLGNSRLANCSKFLKQQPCRKWLDENCYSATATVYVGIDWTESHRMPAIEHNYQPFVAKAPLIEPPYVDKQQMLDECRAWGVEPPKMYQEGWPHANCQAACVRGGQAQWRKLLALRPDAYAYHEAQEQALREHLDKDVAILKDRSQEGIDAYCDINGLSRKVPTEMAVDYETDEWGNDIPVKWETVMVPRFTTVPLTLRGFREQQQNGQGSLFDADDWGGCGCFVDEVTA